jgi:hypothetical protein
MDSQTRIPKAAGHRLHRTAQRPPVTPDPYREAVRNAWPPERLLAELEELADSEKTTAHDVKCKSCQGVYSYRLASADGPTRLKALSLISDLGYGKPAPVKPEEPQKPVPLDVDPATMTSHARQQLIAQLRARLTDSTEPDISLAV